MKGIAIHLSTGGLVAGLALVAASPLLADPSQHVVVEPKFEVAPTADQLAQYYPEKARLSSIQGTATLRCEVRINYNLDNCSVLSEDPAAFGFGEAAAKVAMATFRVRPRTIDGAPQDGAPFITRITFALGDDTPPEIGAGAYYTTKVQWIQTPTAAQIEAAYPAKATGNGRAQLLCNAQEDGGLDKCAILRELPVGGGFGEAGLSLAHFFRGVRPPSSVSDSGVFVVVPIDFSPPKVKPLAK